MKRLIVNADDYGRTAGVSRGIREAHLNGIVTSTTAMMNMPGVEDALREARDSCPSLGLGVHLVLTAGAPLLPADQVPSLVGEDKRFPTVQELIPRLPSVDAAELKAEWRAQVEKFYAVVGRRPDHLDSHHHISFVSPMFLETMLDLATEYGCAVRRPLAEGLSTEEIVLPIPAPLERDMVASVSQLLTDRGIPHPDHFITAFYDEGANLGSLLRILGALKEGVTEIMCHPGYADTELLTGSPYNRQRERELKALTHQAAKAALAELRITLATFGTLRPTDKQPRAAGT